MDEMGAEDLEGAADCQDTGTCDGGNLGILKIDIPPPTVLQQSLLAAQQFGVIVGVALLVGSLFMLMIGIELGLEWLEDKCIQLCGRKKVVESPPPASLVGSFKRYK